MRIMALPVDKGGCGNYRVRQPLKLIQENTDHDTYIVEKDDENMEEVLRVLPTVDVFVVRQGTLIKEAKAKFNLVMEDVSRFTGKEVKLKAKWVMDIDDNMELISPYSEHYVDSGVEEYYDKNIKKWLWKDGESGFDLSKNRLKLKNAKDSLAEADMVTVTTETLANFARKFNKNVKVLPNCIDFTKWWKLPLKTNKQLRVGWSGGISHYEDWYTIKKPLNKLLREFKFKLIIAGDYFKGIIDEDLRYLVEHYDWVDFSGHSYRMMCTNLDLAIIPLADTPFNKYKSSVKWYEMSAMGVPSVVASVEPYTEVTANRDVVLGYIDSQSFEKSLRIALQGSYLRKKIGKNAYNWVYEHRNAKINTKLWVDAYESLL